MNLTEAVDFEYPEKDMAKPLKNITLAEADSTETFTFKPFEYERGVVTKTTKGVINTIRDMQDLPEQVKIFGKRLSFGFGGYFGDTEEDTERKKLNLITAERNLNEAQAERYRFSSQKETESLSYGLGSGIVNYGIMLLPAAEVGGFIKGLGASAKIVRAGAEAAGLGTMGVMELAGQVQDKTPMKDGEIDVEAMTPEWARKATGGTIAYTGISALTEKYVGFGQQIKMWNKPIKWGGNVTSKALTTLKTAGKNALSEGMTEGIQDLEATGIGLIDGTLEMDKLPARLQQAWKSAIIGGIIGGGVGTAAAMKSARNVKKQLREMVAPVVGEQDANTVAEAIYDAGTDDMTKAISIELELSSELKNKHGKVWNSMLKAVSKEMEGKPRFEAMTEDERAHYANTVAKHFADNVLAEANFRGTTIDGILRASDIRYDKGIKIARHINLFDALKNPEMIPAETKLRKKGTSLIQFLRNSGGIQDEGGNLKSREAQKQYIGLINKNGMTLDDAALLAWQEGYLPDADFNYGRPDINALLDAIDEGLRGNHRYNVVEDETRTFKDALDDLKEQLDNMGIDWQNMTAAEIEKAVEEIPEKESLEREYEFYENYEPEIGMSEDEAEQFAIETEGKEYPVIDDKDLPFYYQLADEMAQLDAENPAYEGETINIDGQEKTVYNSEGERIAQSEAALRNFYKWFGDSKVVDEQGRPLVVYHGTRAMKWGKPLPEFSIFSRAGSRAYQNRVGFFFGETESFARAFGDRIMPVYLNLQNPKIFKKGTPTNEELSLEQKEVDTAKSDDTKYIAQKILNNSKKYTDAYDKFIMDMYHKSGLIPYQNSMYGDFNDAMQLGRDEAYDIADTYREELQKDGYDGVIIVDTKVDANSNNGKPNTQYVAFEPNQIKSTQNRGTYSESENIYYQEGDDRDLVAVHSISARNLEKAIDFGGFPVPSIAIINKNQDFHFNNLPITLVGNKEMIDPSRSRNEVYNRDIWSKTFPFATYGKVKKKTRDDFRDNVKEYFIKTDSENVLGSLLYYIDRNIAPEKAVTEFQDSDGARLMYLEKEKGEKVTIPTYDTAERKIEEINRQYGIEASKEFIEKIAEFDSYPSKEVIEKDILPLINEAIDNSKYKGKEKYADRFREVAKSLFIEDGRIDDFNVEGLIRRCKEYVREKGTKKVDTYALRDMLEAKITDTEDYNKWAEKYIQDNLVGEPMVEVGKKLLPFNLENVTKAMTQGVTKNAQESFVYGSGKVIAAGAKQLKSIKEIKLEGKKLVSQEEQAEKIKELQDDMNIFTNKFMTSSDFTASMQQKEAAFRALGTVTAKENPTNEDMQKALNYEFGNNKKYSDELLAAGVKIAKSSRNLARYYFEAKPQRAIRLNEFSGAIIPTDAQYDSIAKKVEDAGLEVIRSDNQTEALQELDTQNDVFFQSAFAGSRVDYDAPSLEAIGTGEGNAAHGWGLYYALSKAIAERYRKAFIRQEREYVFPDSPEELAINVYAKNKQNREKALKELQRLEVEASKNLSTTQDTLYYANTASAVDYMRYVDDETLKRDFIDVSNSETGQVHEVDIPENPYLLDEQKSYREQSDFVKQAIQEIDRELQYPERKEKIFDNKDDAIDFYDSKIDEFEEKANGYQRFFPESFVTDDGKFGVRYADDYTIYEPLIGEDLGITGEGIYSAIARRLGSQKEASLLLEKYGIKGITYYGRQDGRCFVIFNPEDVKVIQKFYQGEEAPKGYTNITPDEYIIKLLEGADESTLPHELAHYWLNEMWNYTRTGRASENYMKRWQIISDYLGITPEQTHLTPTQQEKFASSYEAYITRGELPTPLIGSVFDDYDKWLQRVYNDYNSINYHVRKGKKVYSHPIRLTDAAIKFFQSMTTGTLEPPALAPKNTGVTIPQEIEMPEVAEPTNEIVETPTTYDTTRVINIKEGEKGVSKVFKREAMKHADRIVDELGVSYNKINLEEQAVKAAEWVQNNLEEARKVVNGAAAPDGIIDTAIFIAYENEMLRIGNNAEYQRALKIHSQVQTQRGQAIAAERITTDDVYNPAYWWKKLQKSKETQVAQQLFKGDVKALNEMIETETKSIMKEIAGKPKDEQVKALSELAEKLQKEYNLETLYQMPDEVNERTVKEFIKDTIGVNPDVMAGNEVINKAEQLQKLWENTKDKSGNPSVEAMRAKRELNDLIQAQTPSNKLAIWTSIFGRGIMLTSVKSPVLNIISNIEAGFTEGITRRLMYGTTEKAVDKTVKNEFSKYAWEVYKASSDIVTTMNDYDDDMRIIGEQILHSQGEGLLRAASRKVEEVSFKYLMGAPDAVAKTFAFNDTADLLATKIAREEGAADISKRATEIYKDAILIKPETEQGQLVRKQAQEQAHYTTFTNDSWAAKFGLSARNWLNMVGKNKVRLGDLTMKFVKTPANVQMMGLEYGFGSLYALYNVQEIIRNPQSETSKIAIKAAVRNGLGIALAALLYSMLDPDDYFSEFDTLNPKEKDRMKAMGAMPNSIKIGNRWVSLDYFGQLGIPLVGMLEARRNNGLRSYVQSGLTQAAKIPGIKETKQLIDSMSEYARYDLKPEKIAQMMAGTVLDQARAMTIPAIVNDIAKMTDDYERDTMGGVMDKVIASIPGLRQTLPERYGIQGLVRTEPAVSTLLFGSRVKTAQEDKLVREVEKLAKKDEQPSISDVTKYGDLRLLSPEKKVKVRKEFYQLYNSESKKLISTREYQKKTPEDKKKALNKVRSRVVKYLKEKYSNDIQREKRRQ